MRTDGKIVEKIRAVRVRENSYSCIYKKVQYIKTDDISVFKNHNPFKNSHFSESLSSQSSNFTWKDSHCPPLYQGRSDLYSKIDVEHPLYKDVMGTIEFRTLPYPKICADFLLGIEIDKKGGLNGLCNNSIFTEFNESQQQIIDNLFSKAKQAEQNEKQKKQAEQIEKYKEDKEDKKIVITPISMACLNAIKEYEPKGQKKQKSTKRKKTIPLACLKTIKRKR